MEESISLCTFIWKPSLLPFFQLFFCLLKDVHAQCLLKNIEFKGRSGSARGHSMLLTDILCGSWMSHRALSGGFTLDRKMVETLFYQQNTVFLWSKALPQCSLLKLQSKIQNIFPDIYLDKRAEIIKLLVLKIWHIERCGASRKY